MRDFDLNPLTPEEHADAEAAAIHAAQTVQDAIFEEGGRWWRYMWITVSGLNDAPTVLVLPFGPHGLEN